MAKDEAISSIADGQRVFEPGPQPEPVGYNPPPLKGTEAMRHLHEELQSIKDRARGLTPRGQPAENGSIDIETEKKPKKLIARVLDPEVLKDVYPLSGIPTLIKWQLGKSEKSGHFDPEVFKQTILGMLRGHMAERAGMLVGLAEARTVFSTVGEGILKPPVSPEIVTPKQLTGQDSKKEILAYIAAHAGAGFPGSLLTESAMPDGIVISAKENPIGFYEVKAYTEQQMKDLVAAVEGTDKTQTEITYADPKHGTRKMTLGVRMDAEIKFYDYLCTEGYGLGATGRGTLSILRFPDNIPDETLQRYGRHLQSLGYTRVIIQKLPFDDDELDRLALMAFAAQLSTILLNEDNLSFSNREKVILAGMLLEDKNLFPASVFEDPVVKRASEEAEKFITKLFKGRSNPTPIEK